MPWTRDHIDPQTGRRVRGQITTVQKYRRYCRLPDLEYRAMLKSATGAFSSREPHLTNWHFDNFMAELERRLAWLIEQGVVPAPVGVKLSYWRTRLPKDGAANGRVLDKIRRLWDQLCPLLPEAERTPAYLAAIATHACGYRVADIYEIKAWQARLLTEALKDRLTHALAKAGRAGAAEPALAGGTCPDRTLSAPCTPETGRRPESSAACSAALQAAGNSACQAASRGAGGADAAHPQASTPPPAFPSSSASAGSTLLDDGEVPF